MAQWDFTPEYAHRLRASQPPVQIERLEGNRSVRRRKPGVNTLRVREVHYFTHAQFHLAKTFWELYGQHTPFTKRTYLDAPPHTAEELFYFDIDEFEADYETVDGYGMTIDFEIKT